MNCRRLTETGKTKTGAVRYPLQESEDRKLRLPGGIQEKERGGPISKRERGGKKRGSTQNQAFTEILTNKAQRFHWDGECGGARGERRTGEGVGKGELEANCISHC